MHIYVSRKSGLRTRWVFRSTERKAEKGIGTVNVLGVYRVVKLRKPAAELHKVNFGFASRMPGE